MVKCFGSMAEAFERGWSLVKDGNPTSPTRPAEDHEMHLSEHSVDGIPHVTNENYDTANSQVIANEKGMAGHRICPHCGEDNEGLEIDLDQGMISELDGDVYSVEHDVDCESCGHPSSIIQYLQLTGFERQ